MDDVSAADEASVRRGAMRRPIKPIGSSPGMLVAPPDAKPSRVHVMGYGPDGVEEISDASCEDVERLWGKHAVLWINVDGLADIERLRRIGKRFNIHDLALEDVLASHHRAKWEAFDDYDFLVLRMPEHPEGGALHTDQLSVFAGANFVLTFQQHHGDCFDLVRERIRGGKGRIRGWGPRYLLYALLDAVVDSYYPELEALGETIEELEDDVLVDSKRVSHARIHELRRDLLALRRGVWPLREILHDIDRQPDRASPLDLGPYFRDCYDHVVELIDLIETYRDLAAGLMEVYVSVVGNRMNEIMKVLTIIATIFIPLTFIAGVYGMNFDPDAGPLSMPELRSPYGYVICLAVMAISAGGMLVWFIRRGWIGRREL